MEEEETKIEGAPLGRRFYALYDKKWWKILWQVWQIQTWLLKYEKYDMSWIQIATKRLNLGFRVLICHSGIGTEKHSLTKNSDKYAQNWQNGAAMEVAALNNQMNNE